MIESTFGIDENDSRIIEQQVDIKLARFHGQHFIPLVTTSLSSDVRVDMSTYESNHSLFLGHSVSDEVFAVVKMSSHQIFTMEYPRGQAQAIVQPLHYPSSRLIAPDGKLPTH